MHFRLLPAAAAATSALLLISGCSVVDETNPIAKKEVPKPTVEVTADAPGKKLALKVTDGTFENVQLIDDDAEGSLVDLGEFKDPSDDASEEPTDGATDAAEDSDESSEDASESADPSADSSADASTDPSADASADPSASTGAEASADQQTTWESSYRLAGDSTYTWTASALDADGKEHTLTGTVDTDKLEPVSYTHLTLPTKA